MKKLSNPSRSMSSLSSFPTGGVFNSPKLGRLVGISFLGFLGDGPASLAFSFSIALFADPLEFSG